MIGIVGPLGVKPLVRLSIPVRRLFVLLAISGAPILREVAAARLWPEQSDQAARSNLRRTLFQAPKDWVSSEGDEIRLVADVDFYAARRVAGAAIEGEALSFDEIELLSQDILPGWAEEWLIPAQENFRLLRVQALETACRTMTRSGKLALAAQAGAAAHSAEPLSESAAEALIQCYLAQHNRAKARRCFDALAHRLNTELGVEPDPTLISRLAEAGVGSSLIH
ncbi:MAG: BTAD domain-containing putative transcriptional regulator [Erythrobacter sp.]|nr:BTAD domain-containing putative transcriptional regulator [Erythrobacter sp.]